MFLKPMEIAFIVGGVGIFLYGLITFSDSLKEVAGVRMKSILENATRSPMKAFLTGLIVTSMIQASSVVTVITLAFVNSGLLTFDQSLGLIFGANVGTTITAQIIAFKISIWGFYLLPIGLIIYMVSKKKRSKYVGMAIVSFGCLLIGLYLMEQGLCRLKEYEPFLDMLSVFGQKPFTGIIASTIFTALVQSSSATTSIVVSMAGQGLFATLSSAVTLVLGANIGTTLTTGLASIGANLNAKRVALAHFLFNFVGVMLIYPFIPLFTNGIIWISEALNMTSAARIVANSHTVFNVVWSVFWLWQVKLFAKIIKGLLKTKEKEFHMGTQFLDSRLIPTPSLALDACKSEIKRMAVIAKEMLELEISAITGKIHYSESKKLYDLENLVNEIQRETLKYLRSLYEVQLTEDESKRSLVLMQVVDDIERWGDHATNLYEFSEYIYENNVKMTSMINEKIEDLFTLVNENLQRAIFIMDNYEQGPSLLAEGTKIEEKIDILVKEIRSDHCLFYIKGETEINTAVVFTDIIINLERAADHAYNIIELFATFQKTRESLPEKIG
ncbi:MAG: Na/Pi cotransporter family protein [Caldisericia bacterium]|nr:Na/Pi cotransporter family protein [Caldisericia bacterium]